MIYGGISRHPIPLPIQVPNGWQGGGQICRSGFLCGGRLTPLIYDTVYHKSLPVYYTLRGSLGGPGLRADR